MNRRRFIGTTLVGSTLVQHVLQAEPLAAYQQKIYVFSKMFQWIEDYELLAKTIKGIGFDGIDLTVRPGGHVLPERVEEDLAKAVAAFKKHGLEVPLMVTAILEGNSQTERILKTAQSLGIKHYRMGWYPYNVKEDIVTQTKSVAKKMKGVAQLNQNMD
ncbi:MAG: hypothetical protein R2822_11140 [Spirosomataceae bacterium]